MDVGSLYAGGNKGETTFTLHSRYKLPSPAALEEHRSLIDFMLSSVFICFCQLSILKLKFQTGFVQVCVFEVEVFQLKISEVQVFEIDCFQIELFHDSSIISRLYLISCLCSLIAQLSTKTAH